MKKIYIKNTKTIEEYIQITENTNKTNTLYIYKRINNKGYTQETSKSTFNKYSFINYLKSINIPKKYIKEVECN